MLKKDMIKALQEKEEMLWDIVCKHEELFGLKSDLSKCSRYEWCVVNDILQELGISPTRNGIEIL